MRHDVVAEVPDRNRRSDSGEKACFFTLPVVARRRLLRWAPLLAAVVFGSWAAFVNSEYGMFVLLRSGLGQGVYALCSTWIVSKVATNVFAFTASTLQGMILSFFSSFLVMVSIPLTIHHLIGTPEIANAILPGLLWGSVYLAVYIWVLSKTGRRLQKPTQTRYLHGTTGAANVAFDQIVTRSRSEAASQLIGAGEDLCIRMESVPRKPEGDDRW